MSELESRQESQQTRLSFSCIVGYWCCKCRTEVGQRSDREVVGVQLSAATVLRRQQHVIIFTSPIDWLYNDYLHLKYTVDNPTCYSGIRSLMQP